MQVIEKVFAAVILAVCLLLLVRMLLGPARRGRFDTALRRWRLRWGRRLSGIGRPTAQARAERAAAEAIERARRASAAGDWDGNVYRPKSFKRKAKKRDLH